MTIADPRHKRILLLIAASFLLIRAAFFVSPALLTGWERRTSDLLFRLRNNLDLTRPAILDAIVHVDVDVTTMDRASRRRLYTQLITVLHRADVSTQVFDVVFGGTTERQADSKLLQAIEESRRVVVGTAFSRFASDGSAYANTPQVPLGGGIQVVGALTNVAAGSRPLPLFEGLSEAAAQLGFLNVQVDNDGVFRRVPLVTRSSGHLVPSLSLAAVGHYLRANRIDASDGLLSIRKTVDNAEPEIPKPVTLDDRSNLVVNFAGGWDAFPHYDAVRLIDALGDRKALELWREELSGKIAIVSDVGLSASDIGAVPIEPTYPLSGLHANAIHTMLSGDYVSETSLPQTIVINLVLAILIAAVALQLSPARFAVLAGCLCLAYAVAAFVVFCLAGLIMQIVTPLLAIAVSTISVFGYRHVSELEDQVAQRTRELEQTHSELAETQAKLIEELDRELQTARRMQMALMPDGPPRVLGLDIDGRCLPASQVGGDFYQFFEGANGRLRVALADVTGHAMEAAIPVTMFSGLLTSVAEEQLPLEDLFAKLNRSLYQVLDRRTFVCFQMLDIDPENRRITFCNAGSPYPLIERSATNVIEE